MIVAVLGSRVAQVAMPLLLAACSAEAPFTPETIETTVARAPLRMSARIDGFACSATTEARFAVSGIEVNKGCVRVIATCANTGVNLTAPLTAVEFELRVSATVTEGPLPSRVVYTAEDAFGGSLYWIAPGQAVPVFI